MKEKKYVKNCSVCNCEQSYKIEKNRDRAVRNNSLCRTCAMRKKALGKSPTAETRARLSAATKGKPRAYNKILNAAANKMWGDKYKQVRARDNNTCQKCDKVATGCSIHAHHIVPKEYFMARALDIDNGVTLCSSCHGKVHAELDTYVLNGTKLSATDFQRHLKGFINGPIKE